MVSNAREDFPLPLIPVMTTSLSRGMRRSMDLRLCSLAPMTSIQPSVAPFSVYCFFAFATGGLRCLPKAERRQKRGTKLGESCGLGEGGLNIYAGNGENLVMNII